MSAPVTKTDITAHSTTLADVTGGGRAVTIEKHGNRYRLVKATGASIVAGALCAVGGVENTVSGVLDTDMCVTVLETTNVTDAVFCGNPTGEVIAANEYFWGIQYGVFTCLTDTNLATANTAVGPTAADGEVGLAATAADVIAGIALEADTGTVARIFVNLPSSVKWAIT